MKFNKQVKSQGLKEKIKLIVKRLDNEDDEEISVSACNKYIDRLDNVKNELIEQGDDWVEEFDDVDQVSVNFITGEAADEDIEDAMGEVREQFADICINLGIDAAGSPASQNMIHQPIVNQYISQTQGQSAEININIEVQTLVSDFEKELNKTCPDKGKLKSILEKLLQYGGSVAMKALELLLKYWDKLL